MRRASLAAIALAFLAWGSSALAVDPPPPPLANPQSSSLNPQSPVRVREIYVPFDDLSVLLENRPERVLLPKAEYEELLAKARRTAQDHAPREAMLVSAEYAATAADERAEIAGTILVSVLEDGLHAVGLDLGGVGLRRATLDGRGAPIGRADDGRLTLFVEGKGEHKLFLDLVAPIQTTAARQFLNFRLPTPAAATLSLTIPGDIEVKSGAAVVSRTFDEKDATTRIQLLAQRGDLALVMSLNSRLKRKDRIVVARSVLVDEVTAGYERLHVTASMGILHRAVDQFRFAVPAGFDVTDVRSPALARWAMVAEGGRRVLEVQLREETTDPVVLNLSAVRTAPKLDPWTLPKLEPLDVAGQVAVVCLAVEDRLKAEAIVADGLVPIDTAVLAQALPATVLEAEAGAARLRPVVAYYAPQGQFSLAARIVKPPAGLRVITNLLATLTDGRIDIRGGFALVPEEEKLFALDFSVPAGWDVTAVTDGSGRPLALERYPGTAGGPAAPGGAPGAAGRVHVRLPAGAPAGAESRIEFTARHVPAGWFADWATTAVDFPAFVVAGASHDEGAIAVDARDDMTVAAESLDGLTPLDDNEKARYGLSRSGSVLAYRYEAQPYKARLAVERTRPRITAQAYSFFRVERDALVAHYELVYDVAGARTRRLALVLPKDTPTALAIRGLGGLVIKEYTSDLIGEKDGERRRWTALLADGRSGVLRLAVDFEQRLTGDLKSLALPVIEADGAAYQSGLVSVEGSAELAVQIKTGAPRKVDIGELVAAEYQPGRRLLGVYGYLGSPPPVKVAVTREPAYGLPPAVVQRGELKTVVSADGVAQVWATFLLKTKALVLEVKLPEHSSLWSASLDGQPLKPQREGDSLLVNLPAGGEAALRNLRVVYDMPVTGLGFWRGIDVPAPRLLLHQAAGAAGEEVPLVDLLWQVYLPQGYKVVRAEGTVETSQVQPPPLALSSIGGALWSASGGVDTSHSALALVSGFGVVSMKEAAGYRGGWDKDAGPPAFEYSSAAVQHDGADMYVLERGEPIGVVRRSSPKTEDAVRELKPADMPAARGRLEAEAARPVAATTPAAPPPPPTASPAAGGRGARGGQGGGGGTRGDVGGVAGYSDAGAPKSTSAPPGRGPNGEPMVPLVIPQPKLMFEGTPKNIHAGDTKIAGVTLTLGAANAISGTTTVGTESLVKLGAGSLVLAGAVTDLGDARLKPAGAGTGGQAASGTRLAGAKDAKFLAGWGVEGLSSLMIDIDVSQAGRPVVFQSLGSEPRLRLTVADDNRVGTLAWALALAVLVAGVALTTRPAARKAAYVVLVCLVATLIPVITARPELAAAVNGCFWAACLLVPYYIAAGAVRWLVRKVRGVAPPPPAGNGPSQPRAAVPQALLLIAGAAATLAAASSLGAGASVALAQPAPGATGGLSASVAPPPPAGNGPSQPRAAVPQAPTGGTITFPAGSSASFGPYTIELVPPAGPVRVPDDAIILPYDPSATAGPGTRDQGPLKGWFRSADRVLVPYARYEELWNLAYPDKALAAKKPPAAFALAGASLTASLPGTAYPGTATARAVAGGPAVAGKSAPSPSIGGDEFLLVEGTIDIDVYTDEYVSVPLPLEGGVLARADLDGKPARLSVVAVSPPGTASPITSVPQSLSASVPQCLFLYVSGKGRHRLDLAVRMRLEKRGGWRVAEGRLPAAPATALAIAVPDAGTEIRLGAVPDRRSYETKSAGELIRTALPADGAISIQWRPKVSEGQVDQTLTADSRAVLDVQEDSVHVAWALALEFRRGERDFFTIDVPQGYLVEKVEGSNVRGWEMREAAAAGAAAPGAAAVAAPGAPAEPGELTVTLLKRAKGTEAFTVSLWRPTDKGGAGTPALASAAAGEFVAPVVGVTGALRHSGEIVIRRSPLLDLRTVAATGVTAIDMPTASSNPLLARSAPAVESPLGIRPYQAYRFAAAPFTIRLAAAPVTPKVAATVQTVLKVGQRERTLESRIMLAVEDRPLYRARIVVPADLKIDAVQAPGTMEWALTDEGGRKVLTVYLAAGVRGSCPILIQGKLGPQAGPAGAGQAQRGPAAAAPRAEAAPPGPAAAPGATGGLSASAGGDQPRMQAASGAQPAPDAPVEAALPRVDVLDCDRQEGDIAVQVEPAWEARAEGLANIERVLLDRFTWLAAGQKSVAALALHYTRPDYAGSVRLSRRKPDVTCIAVTNSRITDSRIEEAVLIDWTITSAGIRRVEFLLPAWMKDARIRVPLLRQKTIVPLGDDLAPVAAGKPAAFVRVALDLQDEVMGQLRVLAENDRLLTDAAHDAPIPVVLTGRTDRRYVAVESAGRDEVVIARQDGLEPLRPQQKEWAAVSGLFRGGVTQAFIVAASAQKPALQFRTQARKAVETAEARIGLAETALVMDSTGAYRAEQVFWIDNRTEQFLEIQLPEGAALWTAVVAGEPVKPVLMPSGTAAGRVRIPIVKTAAGDLDYSVVLKYAGKLPPLGSLRMTVRFPMVRAINIQPEVSQLRLYVPEGYSWFDFRPEDYGWYDFRGRMVRASDADLKAGQLGYENKKVEQLLQVTSSDNEFAKTRARYNLGVVAQKQVRLQQQIQSTLTAGPNKAAQDEFANASVLQDRVAKTLTLQGQQAAAAVQTLDNNDTIRRQFAEQRNIRAGQGLQNAIGYNWNAELQPQGTVTGNAVFNGGWFDANGLLNPQAKAPDQQKLMDQGRVNFRSGLDMQQPVGAQPGGKPQAAQPAAQQRQAQAAGEEMFQKLAEANKKEAPAQQMDELDQRYDNQSKSQLYQQRFTQAGQQEQQAQNLPRGDMAGRGKGQAGPSSILHQYTGNEIPDVADDHTGRRLEVLGVGGGGNEIGGFEGLGAGPGGAAGGAAAAPAGPTGFASLDFVIPKRGQPYFFTTVRGNLGIAAAAASEPMIDSLVRIGGVLAFIVAVLVARRLLRGRSLSIRVQSTISTALILLGVIGMFVGVFWVAGLVAAIVGVALKIRLYLARRRPAPAAL